MRQFFTHVETLIIYGRWALFKHHAIFKCLTFPNEKNWPLLAAGRLNWRGCRDGFEITSPARMVSALGWTSGTLVTREMGLGTEPTRDMGLDLGPAKDTGLDSGSTKDEGLGTEPARDMCLDPGPVKDTGLDFGSTEETCLDPGSPSDIGLGSGTGSNREVGLDTVGGGSTMETGRVPGSKTETGRDPGSWACSCSLRSNFGMEKGRALRSSWAISGEGSTSGLQCSWLESSLALLCCGGVDWESWAGLGLVRIQAFLLSFGMLQGTSSSSWTSWVFL